MSTSAATELDAVNTILAAVGETPINSLDTQTGVDVSMARSTLSEVTRRVCGMGWYWNTRKAVEYPPDASTSLIILPKSVIRVDGGSNTHYTLRGQRLFDLKDGVSSFDDPVKLEIIELLPWEEIPHAAQDYISLSAARIYADRSVTSTTLSRALREDEERAMIALKQEEAETADVSVYDTETIRIIDRGSPLHEWIVGR